MKKRSKYFQIIQKIRLKPLANHLSQLMPEESNRLNWKWVADHDARADIEKIKCLVLLLFGELDDQNPTKTAVNNWRASLSEESLKSSSILVFPGAGHGIRMRADHNRVGKAPCADGYMEVQIGWLWKNILPR